jgi:hypothetical protein
MASTITPSRVGEAHKVQDLDAKFRVKKIARELAESDATMIRALEDLMMALLKRKVIGMGDLHPTVVEKIKQRRKLREEMKELQERLGGPVTG